MACAAFLRVAQIGDDEVIGGRGGEFGIFEVDAANPEAFALQTLHQMRANEPPTTTKPTPISSASLL